MSNRIYLGIGSNVGNRVANINQAWRRLSLHGSITNSSYLYQSAPMYYSEQPSFLNAVLEYRSDLEAQECMTLFQGIEAEMGRDYQIEKGPRPIDIDILLFNQQSIDTPLLTVPHADMLERDFVIAPLLDIDPSIVHPVYGQPISCLSQVSSGNNLKRVLVVDKGGEEVIY